MQSVQFTPSVPQCFFQCENVFWDKSLWILDLRAHSCFLRLLLVFFSFYLGQPYPTPRGLLHYPSCTPEPGPTSAAEQLHCNTPAKSYVNLLTVSKDSSTYTCIYRTVGARFINFNSIQASVHCLPKYTLYYHLYIHVPVPSYTAHQGLLHQW